MLRFTKQLISSLPNCQSYYADIIIFLNHSDILYPSAYPHPKTQMHPNMVLTEVAQLFEPLVSHLCSQDHV